MRAIRYSPFVIYRFLIILVTGYWLLITSCFAQAISSTDLIENSKAYDGKSVVYEGEVIGEIMPRGDYAWVNVNDGDNSIGIWSKRDLLRDIVYKGNYKHTGDRVEIAGTFYSACLEHGGDLDIHAYQVTKKINGKEINRIVNPEKKKITIYLGIFLCSLLILKTLKSRQ